ncbi:MAG TPA: GWxTD domain-containing protein [Longimicrobiales bacterium]|nr:GWxTD domain-containing protein [Longimicrobiales bacterium]
MAIPLLVSGIAFSGVQKAEAQQNARLRVARFWRGEGRTLLEGIVGLPIAKSTRSVHLAVKDSTGRVLYNEAWTDSANAQAASLGANVETTTPLELILQPGLYSVMLNANQGGAADSAMTAVRAFPSTPVVSDVVLGAHMRVLAENEKPQAFEMQRGRYAIERGTRVTVLPTEPRLWYYLELYRQGADSVADLEFRVKQEGKDESLVKVNRRVAVGARGTVDAAALVVQGLPPGNYVLQIEAKSGSREEKREAFFTMATLESVPVAEAPAGGSNEGALLDRYFAQSVASDAEIANVVEAMTVGTPGPQVGQDNLQLTTDAKRRFLARYWARVPDPKAETPAHEMVVEYMARVRHVQREFAERGRSGVKTDRGRLYLRYGAPDASQHLQIPTSNKTVEIWKYTRSKSLKYVFLDESGFQNYNLVFTTDPNERTLSDWQARIHDVDILRQVSIF